jgi:hypothetical protein
MRANIFFTPGQDFAWEEHYLGCSHIFPTLGVCIAKQRNSSVWRSSFVCKCSLTKILPKCYSWFGSHVLRRHLSIVLFNLHLKG